VKISFELICRLFCDKFKIGKIETGKTKSWREKLEARKILVYFCSILSTNQIL